MALITVAAGMVLAKAGDADTCKMRIYAKHPFVANDGADGVTIAGSRFRSSEFYQEIDCTVNGQEVSYPSFDLYSTTDAISDPKGTYYDIGLFSDEGAFLTKPYKRLIVDDNPTNQTLAEIALFSGAASPDLPDTYYDAQEINFLLSQLQGQIDQHLAGEASLAAAITAIGGDEADLYVKEDIIVAANTTIPANIRLVIEYGAIITVNNGRTLTINALKDPGNVQVFTGPGAVLFARGSVDAYRTAWRTGVDSGDVTFAINEGLANLAAWNGGVIKIPAGDWVTDGEHILITGTTIEGVGRSRDTTGMGTSLTLTDTPDGMFEFGPDTYFVTFRGIHADGDDQGASNFLYGAGAGIGAFPSHGFYFDDCVIRGFADSCINLDDTAGTGWQVSNVVFRKSFFIANGDAVIRTNSPNMDTITFRDCILQTHTGQIAILDGVYNMTFDACHFAGHHLNLKGRQQIESQTIVAPAGITGDGTLPVTVTWPGRLGAPVTVVVNVTTALTTAAAIATFIAAALEKNSDLHTEFLFGTDNSTQLLVADLVCAANVGGANIEIGSGTSTGVTPNAASFNAVAGLAPVIPNKPAVQIANGINNVTFKDCTEEGFGVFVEATGSHVNFNGTTILDPVKGTSPFSTVFNTNGCKIMQKSFQGEFASIDLLTSLGDHTFPNSFVGPVLMSIAGTHLLRYGYPIIQSNPYTLELLSGADVRFRENGDQARPTEKPLVKITSGNPVKNLLQLGFQVDENDDDPVAVFNFSREAGLGHLQVAASSSLMGGVFDGLYLTGHLRAARFNTTREQIVAPSGTVVLDTSYSNRFQITPGADLTLEVGTFTPGSFFFLYILTSGVTSWNITFGTGFNTIQPYQTGTVSGAKSVLMFYVTDSGRAELVSDSRLSFGPTTKLYDSQYASIFGATTTSRLMIGSTVDQAVPAANNFTGLELYNKLVLANTVTKSIASIMNVLNISGSPAGAVNLYGQFNLITSSAGSSIPAGSEATVSYNNADFGASNGLAALTGVYGAARIGSVNVGNITDMYGVRGIGAYGYSAVATNVHGVQGLIQGGSDFGGSAVNAAALSAMRIGIAANVTNLYGLKIGPYTGSVSGIITNNHGIFIDSSIDAGTNRWAIKSESVAASKFEGTLESTNVALNGQGVSLLGFPAMEKWGTHIIQHGSLAVGQNDVYTVPVGFIFVSRTWALYGMVAGHTTFAGVKIGADYFRLGQLNVTGANLPRSDAYCFAYAAGEIVSISSTVVGKYALDGYLIPDTAAVKPVRPMVTTQAAATDTLLYTVPGGKKAILIPPYNLGAMLSGLGTVGATNDSGGAATVLHYLVPNGQVVGAGFIVQQAIALANGGIAQPGALPVFLNDGDRIYYQTSIATAGQVFFATILEF
ncbi:MAG: hypothetical protein ABL984_16045 [Pyrinomonadaceae bacterium]